MGKLLQLPLLFEALLENERDQVADDSAGSHVPEDLMGGRPNGDLIAFPEASPVPDAATPPDAGDRQRALDIHASWIVEAPAGSGKTGLLIQRYLNLLAHGEVDRPEEILAITFTRKADAEMRHRVLHQLVQAQSGQPLPATATSFDRQTRGFAEAALERDRALGWGLLENPRQLNIRTIDSFSAELAGSTPLLAGPGGRYSPTDDPEPLYDLAAERTVLLMGGDDPVLTHDLQELLLYRDAQPADLKRLLAEMLRQRDQWGELIPLDRRKLTDEALEAEVRPRLDATLRRLLGQDLEAIADRIGQELLAQAATLAQTLSTCPGYQGATSPLQVWEGHPGPPSADPQSLPRWKSLQNLLLTGAGTWRRSVVANQVGFEATRAEQASIVALINAFRDQDLDGTLRKALCSVKALPEPEYPEEQWRVVKRLCRVLHRALIELQVLFGERRTCDFAEVSLAARALLRSESSSPDLLNTAVGRLKHMLVDEMQDTSAGQYELLEAVTAGWDGSTQTLFLVGDPKQSIYEFRQARVERFRRVMEQGRFGGILVGALRLTANFRSQASLVQEFNTTFGAILPSPEALASSTDSVDVPFIAAAATRPPGTEPAFEWHFSVEQAARDQTDDSSRHAAAGATNATEEAREIRERIERYFSDWETRADAGTRPPRVAVLARNRGHLAPVIQEFHQDRGRGPLLFRAVDVEALGERPEVLDLLALTRALLHPADRVAWLAVLRSPVCGLSLGDLLLLTGDGSDDLARATVPHLVSTRSQLLSEGGQQLLHRAWPVLHQAVATLGQTPFSTHLERTWRTLGGDVVLHAPQRNHATRFLDLLHTLETGPEPLTVSLLTRRLRTLYAQPDCSDAHVELMTIHKAKGLEWDLVLIPGLHRGSGRNAGELLKWLEFEHGDGTADFLLAPIQGKGEAATELAGWMDKRQRRRAQAEAKRLFYVACTRAREELHLFAVVNRKADGSIQVPARSDSLLAAAWTAAEPFLPSLPASPERAEPGFVQLVPRSQSDSLALAAAGDDAENDTLDLATGRPRRLPAIVDRLARFAPMKDPVLPYPEASLLRRGAAFTRPEGSFSARAFGNVVHRFLQLLSTRLETDHLIAEAMVLEVQTWGPRLRAALRSEGLAPGEVETATGRALAALEGTLTDPEGAWLLSPQVGARDESALPLGGQAQAASLRADRTFFAGAHPFTHGESSHFWIVDYKTTELGGRSREAFLQDQRAKYLPQMEAYGQVAERAGIAPETIRLALYFPLVPALIFWPYQEPVPPS